MCRIDSRTVRTEKSGKDLDSARVMSNVFCTQPQNNSNFFDSDFTLSMMQWAQVVTHDVSGTSGKGGEFKRFMYTEHLNEANKVVDRDS